MNYGKLSEMSARNRMHAIELVPQGHLHREAYKSFRLITIRQKY